MSPDIIVEPVAERNTLAFIIAIEEYRHAISNVDYAVADATAFADALATVRPDAEIQTWLNHYATRSAFYDELRYAAGHLGPEDEFILYYAGHGFYGDGVNRLTSWDSVPTDLAGTTIPLNDVVLEPLKQSSCENALLFIDACAADLDTGHMREVLSTMNERELREFFEDARFIATFVACKPGEKSFSSPSLQHGIWTHFLIEALGGHTDALSHGHLTFGSLQDYLCTNVQRFIREQTDLRRDQTPYLVYEGNHSGAIARYADPPQHQTLTELRPRFDDSVFRHVETGLVRNLPNFKRGSHFVPTNHHSTVVSFIHKLYWAEIEGEVSRVCDVARKVLGIRRRQINEEDGRIDTPLFRAWWELGQDPEDHESYQLVREIQLRVPVEELPAEFDDVFEVSVSEMVVPLDGADDYDAVGDLLDDFTAKVGIELTENKAKGLFSFTLEGVRIDVSTFTQEMVLSPPQRGCIAVATSVEQALLSAQNSVPALEAAESAEGEEE